jgi:multidrug resistance efflux pump
MPESSKQSELQDLKGKVNVLSAIIRASHEAFDKKDLDSLSYYIVNSSRPLLNCARSAFLDMRGHSAKILSISGQNQVNPNSEYSENLKILAEALREIGKFGEINDDLLKDGKAKEKAFKALEYFQEEANHAVCAVPLHSTDAQNTDHDLFLWVVEFPKMEKKPYEKLLFLLGKSYGQALQYLLKENSSSIFGNIMKRGRKLSPFKYIICGAVIFFILMFFIKVNQTASADFEIIPAIEHISYAPFEGIIKKSFFDSGKEVKKGELILLYEKDELLYELAEAQKEFEEISAELDRIRQKSFAETQELAKVKLLALRKEKKKININRIKWRLERMDMTAKNNGTLVIAPPEEMCGRAVRAGDKLFEVLSPETLMAKVFLNEKDSSVLGKDSSMSLYLHTRPETPISGKIASVTPKPQLAENGQFCYIIKTEIKGQPEDAICGMRGIAKVKGKKVSLAYFLFRNLVLWWRKI